MKITHDEYGNIVAKVQRFLEDLEEYGISSAVVSISSHIDEAGWVASHWNAGDPLACKGLAEDYLHGDDEDGGVFVFRGGPDGCEPDGVEFQ